MSELINKIEEVVGGVFGNNHELKPVAEPALVAAVQAGLAILTPEHLSEIKLRRAVADLDTLIAACEKFIELVNNFVPAEKVAESLAPAEEPAAEAETPAEEAAPSEEPEAPEAPAETPAEPAATPETPEAPAAPETPAEPAQEA